MWRNWSGELECAPQVEATPASTEEVAEAVGAAAVSGRTVRVAGAGHSFSDLVPTDGTLLSLARMGRVLDADRSSGLVRVQAGARIAALADELAQRHDLAFENLGDINVQAIAGAVATGTHGTGAGLPAVHARIEAVQLVAGDGMVVEIDGSGERGEAERLRAARVSLGALGVVTELTLRCVPAFTLRGVDAPRPLDDVLASLDEHAAAARHFEFFVFPHARDALTRTNEIVDEPPAPPGAVRRWLEDVALTNGGLGLACRLARARSGAIPAINRAVTRAAGTRTRIDRSDRIFASPRHVRFTEMELAFPREVAAEAVRAIKAEAERHPVPFPIEVRFVAADDALLGPASGRDTAYVAVHQVIGMPWKPFFDAVWAIAVDMGARPHWGKRHPADAAWLAERYPGWDAFQAVRSELDPKGVFTNAGVERVLGPVGAATA